MTSLVAVPLPGALIGVVGAVLSAGVALAGAPLLGQGLGMDPILAARVALCAAIATLGLALLLAFFNVFTGLTLGAACLAVVVFGAASMALLWIRG